MARVFQVSRAGTLQRHVSAWTHWEAWSDPLGVSVCEPSLGDVLDFLFESLHALRADRRCNRPRTDVRSLVSGMRFMAAKVGLPGLEDLLQNPAVFAYSRNVSSTRDRREAPPLPLASVVAMERRVRDPDCPATEILVLGGFLACVWGSLRFGDAQRCNPSLLTLERGVVRGLCWRTKTSQTGQAWGCLAEGFSGRSQAGWAHPWLNALQGFVARAPADTVPDYLVPEVVSQVDQSKCVFRPMPYSKALCALRLALQQSWMGEARMSKDQARAYSLHGLKCTALSWARQLGVPEELRREQGHHRAGAGTTSTRLYSRDDVWGPLQLQAKLVAAVRGGWRPLTPQARGAMPPLSEPPVAVANLPVDASLAEAPAEPCDETDSSSGSSLCSSTESAVTDEADYVAHETLEFPEDCLLVNWTSMRFHAARPCDAAPSRRTLLLGGRRWRAACGALLPQAAGCCEVRGSAPGGAVACSRGACAAALCGAPRDVDSGPESSS